MEGETTTATGTHKSIQLLQDAIEQLSLSRCPNPFSPSHQIQIKSEHQISPTANSGGDEAQILTELICQLESLKQDGIIKQSESSPDADVEQPSSAVDGKENKNEDVVAASETAAEEIVKELRNVKRQNTVTHWLLSGLIVLTLACQLSEVSIFLRMKDGLNHPVSTLGRWLKGVVSRQATNGQDAGEKQASTIKDSLVKSATKPLKVTREKISKMDLELPHVQLPSLVSTSRQDK